MKRRGSKRGLIPQGIIPLPATEAQGTKGKRETRRVMEVDLLFIETVNY